MIKIAKVEQQHVWISFGIYCKKKFVLIPRAIFLREITEPFRQLNMESNDLCENVLY